MSAPVFTAANFLAALQALLPRGRVWPRDPDAVMTKIIGGFAPSFARQSDRASNLIVDSFPASTLELLPEWEETLGLPDPCAGQSPTIIRRRAQVVARFADTGGQSAMFFKEFAEFLGYTITITNYAPFRAGQSRAGDSCGGEDWFFAWAINAPLNSVSYFRAGNSAAGEPLASWSNDVLECEISALAPAQSVPIFQYQ